MMVRAFDLLDGTSGALFADVRRTCGAKVEC